MDNWQSTFLGLKRLPRELTAFEIEAFFTFTRAERQLIEDRRRAELMLGLALQIGFLRMSGRLLDAVPMVPPALWRHLGTQFAVVAPDLASLRALYRRAPTLIEHQQLACEALGFRWLSEPQRRALVRGLRRELARTRDRERLLGFARRWLYEHQLIIMHERALRSIIVSATRQYEAALARSIRAQIDSDRLECWRQALVVLRQAGLSQQSWLWAAPAKHSQLRNCSSALRLCTISTSTTIWLTSPMTYCDATRVAWRTDHPRSVRVSKSRYARSRRPASCATVC
jgi:hypothetical protein